MKKIPLVGNHNPSGAEGYQFSSSRNVNYYVEGDRYALTPGLVKWIEVGNGPIRGWCLHKQWLIVVSGSNVYRVWSDTRQEGIGTVRSATGPVACMSNGVQVLIVEPDGDGYRYDGTGVTQVTDPDFVALKPTTGVFHDGYGVVNERDTGRFYISSNYDFTAWAALDFATAEAKPDNLVEIISDKNLLWMFGDRTLEVFQNTGNSDFPFEPLRSAFSYYGAYANTVQRMDNTLVWFGKNEFGGRAILRLSQGADPVQVSDERINEWLDGLEQADIDAAFSFNVWKRGHSWYCLTLPDYDDFGKTLVYDATSGAFFEWSTWCDSNDKHGKFRGTGQIFFANLNLVGDNQTGKIYRMDPDVYTDDGLAIKRTRMMETMGKDLEYISWNALQLELETGKGTPGTDYTMALRYSDDRGRRWSHSLTRSIGEGGEYAKKVVWRRLGRSRRRTWEINTTAACDHRINSGYVEAAA